MLLSIEKRLQDLRQACRRPGTVVGGETNWEAAPVCADHRAQVLRQCVLPRVHLDPAHNTVSDKLHFQAHAVEPFFQNPLREMLDVGVAPARALSTEGSRYLREHLGEFSKGSRREQREVVVSVRIYSSRDRQPGANQPLALESEARRNGDRKCELPRFAGTERETARQFLHRVFAIVGRAISACSFPSLKE